MGIVGCFVYVEENFVIVVIIYYWDGVLVVGFWGREEKKNYRKLMFFVLEVIYNFKVM